MISSTISQVSESSSANKIRGFCCITMSSQRNLNRNSFPRTLLCGDHNQAMNNPRGCLYDSVQAKVTFEFLIVRMCLETLPRALFFRYGFRERSATKEQIERNEREQEIQRELTVASQISNKSQISNPRSHSGW